MKPDKEEGLEKDTTSEEQDEYNFFPDQPL